jgi:Ni,Fe-hydrogenase I cytochrome b subunit
MGIRSGARMAYLVVAWLFVACLVVQVFLAGLGVFAGADNFATHRDFGYLFGWLTLILIALAIIGRLGRRLIWLSVLVFGLFVLQSVFVALRETAPVVAALHPVNGFLILLISISIAQRARRELRNPAPQATAEPAAA